MALGLKRGIVELADYDPEGKTLATGAIEHLWRIFGSAAKDIQHVGSTAIKGIKAKPIIDIAVAVEDFAEVELLMPQLNEAGFFKSKLHAIENDMLLCDDDEKADTRSYHIHIVKVHSTQWKNYLNFRDYLNAIPDVAKEYERLKVNLATKHPSDRNAYTDGKDNMVARLLSEAQTWVMLHDIPEFDSFIRIKPITKGMSGDKKYFVETADNNRFLLRIADISEHDRKKAEYEIMQKAASLNIPMSQPVDFGVCNGEKNVYTLLTWIDGEELESILPALSEKEQYSLGIKSGEILYKIHKVTAPQDVEDWSIRYFKVIDERLDAFCAEGIPFDDDTYILDFLEANRHLLKGRPQCRHHGDYHEGNMILSAGNTLSIIDWHTVDFENYGDPWIELARYSGSPSFTSGQINGYFENKPPKDFWVLFAYYLAASAITSIVWAKYFAPERLGSILQLNKDVLLWFDNMQNPVPSWYLKGN